MNMEQLALLTLDELEKVKRKNLMLFNLIAATDLAAFYISLFTENWLLLFLSFGFFVTGIALYENYRVSKELIETRG